MNAPYSPDASSASNAMVVVDVLAAGDPAVVSVRRPEAGPSASPVDTATIEQLRRQLAVLDGAEQGARDGEIESSRRAVGQRLWEILDGPERRLTRAMATTDSRGDVLDLVIRLRVEGKAIEIACHPAARWRWELLSPDAGGHPTADGRIRLVVQLGDVEPGSGPRVLEQCGLRVVFMAYSPEGVMPLLDYEAEEERILEALDKPIRENRARVHVVEDGTLAELERRLGEEPADVVHLTGHGIVRPSGPRLVLEDELGYPDEVTPDDLLRVLKRANRRPELIVISSCHSAEGRDGTPSFAAALVAGGMPAVLGWVRPVGDEEATQAAADLYGRLCGGETPARAVAFVREQLRLRDEAAVREKKKPSHAWGTLHLLMRDARGFRVDADGTKLPPKAAMEGEALYKYLDATGGMRVLERGFIGRRRPLQRLLRVLRNGRDQTASLVAGATVLGMKGVGKSCLVGRALDRFSQVYGNTSLVVLHGVLDDVTVVQRFDDVAIKRGDKLAEAILEHDEPVPRRIHRLLTSHWANEPIVVVLDDFEKNLELRDDGDAVLSPQAAALLEVLLPACRGNRPKLLVTTTASFRMPARCERALAEVALGPLEPPALRKLWMRMPEEDRLTVPLPAWKELSERLGRNARVLEWTRALLRGKAPEEVEALARKAGEEIPQWKGEGGPSAEQQSELARLFLRTLAMEETRKRLSEDALTFIARARVYESPVPKEAFEGLIEGLAIALERDVTVLQNLGMLEVGEMDGQRAHRVSPLVEPEFAAEEAERWHAVAAAFWEQASMFEGTGNQFERTMMAWEHGLAGECEEVVGRCGRIIEATLNAQGLYGTNRELASRHLAAFPESEVGLLWAGSAEERAGDPPEGWALYKRGEAMAIARGATSRELREVSWRGSDILCALGRYADAEPRLQHIVDAERKKVTPNYLLIARTSHSLAVVQQKMGKMPLAKKNLEQAIEAKVAEYGTEEYPDVAVSMYELAGVLKAQGDLVGARDWLERSLTIQVKVYGTVEHPNVAVSLHELACVLLAQGSIVGARDLFERSLAIKGKVYGTEEHPFVAASLQELARVLFFQGDLAGARARLERALAIQDKVHGTQEHPDVAATLNTLASVLRIQGNLVDARACLERALAIWAKVHGKEEHPDVAASLHELASVLQDQGDLGGARARLDRALAILVKVHGTEEHPSVAVSSHTLAGLLRAEGQSDRAAATYRRVLDIEARIFGTPDQYNSAETELSLGLLLLEINRHDEARELLSHAYAVLNTQVPNHPAMNILRQLLGYVPAVDPRHLTRLALQARHSGEAPSMAFSQGLSAMIQAGPPHDAVAAMLEAIASKRPLPPADPSLPEPVATFVEQVLEVARQIDSAAQSEDP